MGQTFCFEAVFSHVQENVKKVMALGLADEVHALDNSSAENPFVRVFSVVNRVVTKLMEPLPDWAQTLFSH